jgi:hypothetical protein
MKSDLLPGFRAGMLLAARLVVEFEREHNLAYRRRISEHIRSTLKEHEMKMNQEGTTRGLKGESGERISGKATSSDSSGERKVSVPTRDRMHGAQGVSGERIPESSSAADKSGERRETITGGVGMGQHDAIVGRDSGHAGKHDGRTGEFNGGRSEGTAYDHKRLPHAQNEPGRNSRY